MDTNEMMASVKQGLGYRSLEISGDVYTLKLCPTMVGLSLAAKFTTLFGPVFGSMADSAKSKDFVMPEEDDTWAQAAMLLSAQMDKVDVVGIIQVLLSYIKKNDQDINIDEEFAGDYGRVIELIQFSLKENFGSFFSKMLNEKDLQIPMLSKMMGAKEGEVKPEQS